MNDIITALYHAASSEEPDTMDGPSLCDYYQRREETEQTRRALVDAVGDEVDVDSYGVAMECQGYKRLLLQVVHRDTPPERCPPPGPPEGKAPHPGPQLCNSAPLSRSDLQGQLLVGHCLAAPFVVKCG